MVQKPRKIGVLALTDSRTHGAYETIYPLLKEIVILNTAMDVFVVDRADVKNKEFYRTFSKSIVYARKVDNSFAYHEDGEWFKQSAALETESCDVLFLRIDRPFTDENLIALKENFPDKTIVNDPIGIIETGSKKFLLEFPSLCPDMILCNSIDDVEAFLEVNDAVFKPLHGYGGDGIFRISKYGISDGVEEISRAEAIKRILGKLQGGEQFIGMKYLKNVGRGDKRVVVAGQKVLGATLRLPKEGGFMCNLKQGGSAHAAEPDPDELQIAKLLMPEMTKKGVLIYGFDTLVDDSGKRILSEINTLNVGGFLQAQEFSGRPVVQQAASEIIKYISYRAEEV